MKFKCFEIYVSLDAHNASMAAIEQKADQSLNDWLRANPRVKIDHFAQSLANLNQTIVYQIGIFYSEP